MISERPRNYGHKPLEGMSILGSAFAYLEGELFGHKISFEDYRLTTAVIFELYERLRNDAHIYNFSRDHAGNRVPILSCRPSERPALKSPFVCTGDSEGRRFLCEGDFAF